MVEQYKLCFRIIALIVKYLCQYMQVIILILSFSTPSYLLSALCVQTVQETQSQ